MHTWDNSIQFKKNIRHTLNSMPYRSRVTTGGFSILENITLRLEIVIISSTINKEQCLVHCNTPSLSDFQTTWSSYKIHAKDFQNFINYQMWELKHLWVNILSLKCRDVIFIFILDKRNVNLNLFDRSELIHSYDCFLKQIHLQVGLTLF